MHDHIRRELVKRLVDRGPDGETRHSRRWFNRVLIVPFAAGVGLSASNTRGRAILPVQSPIDCLSGNSCYGISNICGVNSCNANVCDTNSCSQSNTCTGNGCTGASNRCLGSSNTETCVGSENSCAADNNCTGTNTSNSESRSSSDACYINTCTRNGCHATNSCSSSDKCGTNSCGTDVCSSKDTCSRPANGCTMKITEAEEAVFNHYHTRGFSCQRTF